MGPITTETIGKYLDAYGWRYDRLPDGQGMEKVITGFFSEALAFEFTILITVLPHWIGLTVWPFVGPSKLGYEQLGRINFALKLVRLATNPRGETVMCLDLPSEHVTEGLFGLALDTLTYYAEALYPEIAQVKPAM